MDKVIADSETIQKRGSGNCRKSKSHNKFLLLSLRTRCFPQKATWCEVGYCAGSFRPFRVPAVYFTSANVLLVSFLAFSRISKLRGISGAQNSDSLRLHLKSSRNGTAQRAVHRQFKSGPRNRSMSFAGSQEERGTHRGTQWRCLRLSYNDLGCRPCSCKSLQVLVNRSLSRQRQLLETSQGNGTNAPSCRIQDIPVTNCAPGWSSRDA